jgi:hypothetical protein
MFPDCSVPAIQHERDLIVQDSYYPWVHRAILQSLLDHQVVLEVGSGNMALDDPCIIRMDVTLTPYVDVVADVHALPFLPASIDYIFSLAVVEHLRQPFVAAQSMYDTLKDGGYIYHECNFVFGYHGFPHHYFNASRQGMQQIFSQYTELRAGVAPYQMPGFALESVVYTYLRYTQANRFKHGQRFVKLLESVLQQDLKSYDVYFTEDAAFNSAAATYFSGLKQTTPDASLIPPVIKNIWSENSELQACYPNINDLTTADNVLVWAATEGRLAYPKIDAYLEDLPRFNKRGPDAPWDRTTIKSYPLQEPKFGAHGYDPDLSMEEQAHALEVTTRRPGMWGAISDLAADENWLSLIAKAKHVKDEAGWKFLVYEVHSYLRWRIQLWRNRH